MGVSPLYPRSNLSKRCPVCNGAFHINRLSALRYVATCASACVAIERIDPIEAEHQWDLWAAPYRTAPKQHPNRVISPLVRRSEWAGECCPKCGDKAWELSMPTGRNGGAITLSRLECGTSGCLATEWHDTIEAAMDDWFQQVAAPGVDRVLYDAANTYSNSHVTLTAKRGQAGLTLEVVALGKTVVAHVSMGEAKLLVAALQQWIDNQWVDGDDERANAILRGESLLEAATEKLVARMEQAADAFKKDGA